MGRTLYFTGLQDNSPTFALATNNIILSITFMGIIVFRIEKLIKKKRKRFYSGKGRGNPYCMGWFFFLF